MRNINDNAVQGRLSKNFNAKNYRMKYLTRNIRDLRYIQAQFPSQKEGEGEGEGSS